MEPVLEQLQYKITGTTTGIVKNDYHEIGNFDGDMLAIEGSIKRRKKRGDKNVRVQWRTVSYSEWRDNAESEQRGPRL